VPGTNLAPPRHQPGTNLESPGARAAATWQVRGWCQAPTRHQNRGFAAVAGRPRWFNVNHAHGDPDHANPLLALTACPPVAARAPRHRPDRALRRPRAPRGSPGWCQVGAGEVPGWCQAPCDRHRV